MITNRCHTHGGSRGCGISRGNTTHHMIRDQQMYSLTTGHHGVHRENTVHIQSLWETATHQRILNQYLNSPSTGYNGRPRCSNVCWIRKYTIKQRTTTGDKGRPRESMPHQLFRFILNQEIYYTTTGYHGTPREITARNQQSREAGDNAEPRTNNVC